MFYNAIYLGDVRLGSPMGEIDLKLVEISVFQGRFYRRSCFGEIKLGL